MTVRASFEPETTPARQGQRMALTLAVTNDTPHLLVLSQATSDAPHDERLRWQRQPDGVVVYDAIDDCYHHHSAVAARSTIPLCHSVVQPGRTARTFYGAKSLAPGARRVRVTISGRLLSLEDARTCLYASTERLHGPVTTYLPLRDPEEAVGVVVSRADRGEKVEATAELDLQVTEDAGSILALTQAGPGSTLVDRVRRLGGAWIVRTADGGTLVYTVARAVRCGPGVVDPVVWQRLDEVSPTSPALVRFRSERAGALRDAHALPLEGLDVAQQHLPATSLLDLFQACEERKLAVGYGPHSPCTDGLIVT